MTQGASHKGHEVKGERMNICFIGKRNVGKSSIINKLIGQNVSIVSEQPGTTTDAVAKRYELHPIGAVTIYDTAGYDDDSNLGEKRVQATMKALFRSDLAVIVLDNQGIKETDVFYIEKLDELKIPFVAVWNKSDVRGADGETMDFFEKRGSAVMEFSAIMNDSQSLPLHGKEERISDLKDEIVKKVLSLKGNEGFIIKDLIEQNDKVVLVMPIDNSAPKGRIILPQVQVLREVLDANAIALCCTEKELNEALQSLNRPPKIVITDSQAIDFVSKIVPENINLTTFSVLFARYRGELRPLLDGLKVLKELKEEDYVLVAESCSHHAMDEDIGLVKIPRWIKEYLGFSPQFTKVNGHDFPDDLEKYRLVIHCGGCMMTRMELLRRINECQRRGVAITNYGMLISEVHGYLERVVRGMGQKA